MVVTSRCFAFRALITHARIWKRFELKTLTSLLYLPISSSAETLKIFRNIAHILSEKNPYFGKHLAKQGLITRTSVVYKTWRLVRICLLIIALNKRVLLFFSGKLLYKSNRKLFSWVCISWYKHSRGCYPSRVCITVSNSPDPFRVYIRLCKLGICFLLLKWTLHFKGLGKSSFQCHNFVAIVRPEPIGRMVAVTRGSLAILLFKAWRWAATFSSTGIEWPDLVQVSIK